MSQQDPTPNSIPLLPSNVILEYLAEGAANIIYRIHFPTQSPLLPSPISTTTSTLSPKTISAASEGAENNNAPSSPPGLRYNPIFHSRLLRLRKSLPSTVPNIHSARNHQEILLPLLGPENLIAHDLVKLPPNIIPAANSALQDAETKGLRPPERRGLYLATDEPYGVLVSDMTSKARQQHSNNPKNRTISIEFKPKWLAESPNAPPGARRCRTCALRAQKRAKPSFCPLDLVSSNPVRVQEAAMHILRANNKHVDPSSELQNQLVSFLQQTPLLRRIRQLQLEFDPKGILDPETDPSSTDYLKAMTLRDCTIFLKILISSDDDDDGGGGGGGGGDDDENQKSRVEVRIGDLDLKSPEGGKVAYWKAIEEELISGGWYMGTEPERPEGVQ